MNHGSRGRFRGYSAGSHPAGAVNPLTFETLREMHLPIEGLRGKSWDEFAGPDAPQLDFVFTLCDAAAAEVCPVWPDQPITAHWGAPDPAAVTGSEHERRRAFKGAAVTLKRRVDLMIVLSHASLDKRSLQKAVDSIGRS